MRRSVFCVTGKMFPKQIKVDCSIEIFRQVVLAYENLENPEQYIVRFYEKYLSHLPANSTNTIFYLRWLEKPKEQVWYSGQSVSRHKLENVVAEICKDGNLPGYRTNSLRASSATQMFDAKVDEQLIC